MEVAYLFPKKKIRKEKDKFDKLGGNLTSFQKYLSEVMCFSVEGTIKFTSQK